MPRKGRPASTHGESWLAKQGDKPRVDDVYPGEHRQQYIEKFGYAIINSASIEFIRPYQPLVEVGAGSGYWAFELSEKGVDVVATDPHLSHPFWDHPAQKWVGVEQLDALQAIEKYPNRNLLICWPNVDEEWATEALQSFQGEFVIYVGEGPGGSTGSDRMFQLLADWYEEVNRLKIPTFCGGEDRLVVYHCKAWTRNPAEKPCCDEMRRRLTSGLGQV